MPARISWDRLRRSRVVQVLVVYLGASWLVMQITATLTEALSLPDWVMPVAIVLLLIGVVITVATAWVQSHPATTAAEEAGERPTDWQVAPADAIARLRAGRLPHLTWGRAVLGGVVALSLLFGVAGLYVGLTRGTVRIGPERAVADEAAEGIAVVPFSVAGGDDLALWREGMVDVLAAHLDGAGGFRAIDSRTVMARWRERVEDGGAPDLQTSLRIAGSAGARYGVVGSLVGSPAGVRMNADVYDLSDGSKVATASQVGPVDRVLTLVESLSVEVVRDLLAATGQELIAEPRTSSLTTTSMAALRAYLEGEALFRHSEFAAAAEAYERAVAVDSTFALAWLRLSEAASWMSASNPRGREAQARAAAFADRLSVRDRILSEARAAYFAYDDAIIPKLEEAVRAYPDDPDLWYTLGDIYLHLSLDVDRSWRKISDAFARAVALDPTFAPYHVHWVEGAILSGDTALAREALQRYAAASTEPTRPATLRHMYELFLGDAPTREAAFAALDTLGASELRNMSQWGKYALPDQAWVERVARRAYELDRQAGRWYAAVGEAMLTRGRFDDLATWLADPSGPGRQRGTLAFNAMILGRPLPSWFVAPDFLACGSPPAPECLGAIGITRLRGGGDASDAVAVARANADSLRRNDGSESEAELYEAVEKAVGGLQALHAADTTTALSHLRLAARERLDIVSFASWWRLVDLLERARPMEALDILDSLEGVVAPFARVRAAVIHERMGNREAALTAYRSAWERLQHGDESDPWVEQARAGLARLGG